MKPELLLKADVLDIIFEHRNKEYGAYVLRREYNSRLLKAICSSMALVSLFFLLYYGLPGSSRQQASLMREIKDLELKQVEAALPELPKPPAELPKKVATIKDVVPVIVPDEVKTDPPPTIDELLEDKANIGTVTTAGEAPGSIIATPAAEPGGTGEAVAVPEKEEDKILYEAEVMPEFPGGITGLRRFLGRNLRVPEEVMQPGLRVKIPIRLIVGKDGALTNVDFLVQADEAFKKEILRVVNKMPKWKAGANKGKPVAVYLTIPIVFEVSE